jgi:hypothetical protein
MKLRLLFAALILFSIAAPAAELNRSQVLSDLKRLDGRQLVAEPGYWREHLVGGGKCDGAKVAGLLVELTKVFGPVTSPAEALTVLAQRHIISSPDYWQKNAVPGGECVAANVAIVLNRIAGQLPLEIPKSAKATPLEATPAAQLKPGYDVIVAGAGTGGCGAAVQAARMGRSVLLLEETDWIGGQMNAAAVTSMDEGGTLVRERGLYREWCGLVASYYQPLGINYLTAYWNSHVCVEPRVGRKLLHTLLGDARVAGVLDLALRSRVTKVTKSGDTVTGVEIESITDQGTEAHTIQSRMLIDGTEWGDVIPLTGARYRVGNCTSDAIDPKRHVQDNTWCAVVKQYPQGVPEELRVKQAPPGYTEKVAAAFAKSLGDGDKIASQEKPWTWATFIGYRAMPDSSRPGNSPPITRTHMNYNNDFPATVAEIETPATRLATDRAMRLKTLHLLYYIQQTLGKTDWSVANDEGYDTPHNRAAIDAWLTERPDLAPYRAILYHFAIIPYVRESRRIIGVHTLTAREIDRSQGQPVQFPSTVAIGDYPVDMHGSMSTPYLELDLEDLSVVPRDFHQRRSGPFAIPFESFIPEKVDGFLPAEKNISQSRMSNGATRLQPHTMLMGQVAGAIAALAIQNKVQPRALDPQLVQRTLLDAGCTLTIVPVDAAWGSEEWKAKQLAILQSDSANSRKPQSDGERK